MIRHFRRQLAHMAWADRRVLLALRAVPDAEALRLFAHVLAAERIWLARLTGADTAGLEVWPALALEECGGLAEANQAGFERLLEGLAPQELAGEVTYRNSRGVEFSTSRSDVLSHVMLHGSYHRGQVAATLRRAGAQPPDTDFITFSREERGAPPAAPPAGTATGLALALLLTLGGCAREEVPQAAPGPLVRGEVQALDHRATASGVRVSGTPGTGDPCGIHATVDAESRIVRHRPGSAREAATVAQLAVGDTVEVYVSGPVAESCPLQGRADSLVVVGAAAAADRVHARLTANTVTLREGTPRGAAALESLGWLAGHWQGDGLGGTAEEVWAPPLGGSMMGMFRLVRGDSVAFYEIITLEPEGASLTLRLKHFHPDLTGWEERDEVVGFPLVELTANEARFDGMTFRRVDADRLDVFVAIGARGADPREAAFRYHRVGSAAHRAWRQGR